MIIIAKTVMTPVEISAYTQTMFAVIRKFLSFGYAISRYTCASVSKPLIDNSECPKATTASTIGIISQGVPCSQPCASSLRWMFSAIGAGGMFT